MKQRSSCAALWDPGIGGFQTGDDDAYAETSSVTLTHCCLMTTGHVPRVRVCLQTMDLIAALRKQLLDDLRHWELVLGTSQSCHSGMSGPPP